ncbi:sulfatase [Haloprofundus marisrubri]|uniref:Sulfatase n=1 Tax=Haloprofundus marisrubri TaxID=1514971 RepID=A0A0W1RAR8_9EURY|nr:sulfatase [Haloprofundus marisrubri]KTG10449.1 sulfatase [Haloprofundus marisrubri]
MDSPTDATSTTPASADAPSSNVLLVICDTLRVDALSCYADDAPPTPNLDRLAAEGTTFENAFAVGSWTPPSHGAVFTGRYPSETGFGGAWPSLSPGETTMAERFGEAGYDTIGIPGPSKMGSPVGLDRGFDEYYEVYEEMEKRPSVPYLRQVLTDEFVRRDLWRLATRGNDYYTRIKVEKLQRYISEADAPWFAMANLTTVHAPYWVPNPYMREETSELQRPFFPLLEEFLPSTVRFDRDDVRPERLFAAADGASATSIAMRQYETGDYLNEAELSVLRAWYRACVRYLDSQLGELFDWLDETGRREETHVVLTSDHGECFGEHGAMYHGYFLHDELLHVPLVVSGPDVPSDARRSDLVSLVDLFDTLCDLSGIEAPEKTSGRALFGAGGDETDAHGERDAVFAETAIMDESDREAAAEVSEETRSAFETGKKSIRTQSHRFERRSDGREYLYDVQTGDEVDDAELEESLREQLTETLGEEFVVDGQREREYSAGVERNLRELGYLE